MLKSIEKLREYTDAPVRYRDVRELLPFIDAIEREIAERYIPLPLDADGIPIHVGDMMKGVNKYDSLHEITGKVIQISFIRKDNGEYVASVGIQVWAKDNKSWHVSYLDPDADIYHHVKERTLEDVLVRFLSSCGDDDPHFYDEEIREYADELREMLSQALDHAHSISKLGELD